MAHSLEASADVGHVEQQVHIRFKLHAGHGTEGPAHHHHTLAERKANSTDATYAFCLLSFFF